MTFCSCEFLTQLNHRLPAITISPHLYWAENKKPSHSAGTLEHMLANVTDFERIVLLTVVRDWNDRKEMTRKHPILSLYKILLVKGTVTTIMMGR